MVLFAKGRCDNVRLEASLEMETNKEWCSGSANMMGRDGPGTHEGINQSIQSPPSYFFKHRTVFHNSVLSSWAFVLASGLDVL